MRHTILASAAAISLQIDAQVFEKGYIVQLTGDTIRGEVKLNAKKEHEMFNKVVFKDESGVQKNLKPEKIKAYGYANKVFVSMDSDGEKKFYQALTRGEINMYKLEFESLRMNQAVVEKEYYLERSSDKKIVVVKTSKFKKQAADLMKDKPDALNSYTEEKEFDEGKAAEVVASYNDWKSGKNTNAN